MVDTVKVGNLAFGLSRTQAAQAERRLVEAAQAGDQDAFSELVRMHDRSVLGIALRMLRSREDAQDAYQEAFLKTYRKIHTFRFQCRFHTWLYRIATNVCLDMLRRRKSRPEFNTFEEDEKRGRSPIQLAPDARPTGAPDRMLRSREIKDRVVKAMDRLSERERLVFTLRHYGGMRLAQVGKVCGSSEDSAKQCLFRATRKMRKELSDVRF